MVDEMKTFMFPQSDSVGLSLTLTRSIYGRTVSYQRRPFITSRL
jgi:hypothetical protein